MRFTRGLVGAESTAIAGLSSKRARPSGATRTGFDHVASGPCRDATYTREGASLVQGVERSNE